MSASRRLIRLERCVALCLLALMMLGQAGCGWSRTTSASKAGNGTKASATDDQANDAKALESIGKRGWYDASTAEYRPPRPSEDIDHPLRRNGTFASPAAPKPAAASGTGGGGVGWGAPSGELVGYIILITLGTVLVGVAIALAVASMRSWLPGRALGQLQHKAIAIDPARVADLPFEAQAEMEDPLAYARHLIAQGKYDEAVIFVYAYMLLALDRAGKIMLHRGKTNRMYLQELVGEAELRNILLPAMLAFEDVFFGRHGIEPERFRKIWSELDHFHRALAPSIATAAPIEQGVAS